MVARLKPFGYTPFLKEEGGLVRVESAVVAGVPVIHVPVQLGQETDILWTAFDPQVMTRSGHERAIRKPFDRTRMDWVIEGMIGPPADPVERRHFQDFRAERAHRFSARIEFPLLLSVVGVKRLRLRQLREANCRRAITEEWQSYRERCVDCHGITAPLDLLEQAYGWSDRLAGHYAQTFRSGHVFNFALILAGLVHEKSLFLGDMQGVGNLFSGISLCFTRFG